MFLVNQLPAAGLLGQGRSRFSLAGNEEVYFAR